MSEVKVNKISPRTACGTVTLGDSGDTFTVPSGVTITNNGTQTGFGRTGTVDWVTTPKVTGDSPITAVTGEGYFLNTTAGTITINLPVGAAGSIVSMADYAGTWQTNNVTVAANGTEKIGGVDADVPLSTEGQSVTLVYVDSTQGWLNVQDSTSNVRGALFVTATGGNQPTAGGCIVCTNYKIHKFTGPGTFCVSCGGNSAGSSTVDYMIVAGAGGAGSGNPGSGEGGGGGGAGGWRASSGTASGCYTAGPLPLTSPVSAITVSVQGYPIAVGGGGAGSPAPSCAAGTSGVVSSGLGVSSAGGGGGGSRSMSPPGTPSVGKDGGSGGGGGYAAECSVGKPGGCGNTPSVTPPQGKDGGSRVVGCSGGGGGGGATVAGVGPPSSTTGGAGGAGSTSCITASPVAYSGGGGGGAPTTGGTAGSGGGGTGTPTSPNVGTINTGGGGGGGYSSTNGGTGGSGIVIIRYKFQ